MQAEGKTVFVLGLIEPRLKYAVFRVAREGGWLTRLSLRLRSGVKLVYHVQRGVFLDLVV